MATISGLSFSGIDHLGTIFESANNYFWNDAAADDAYERSIAAANYAYGLNQKSLRESPSAAIEGLERAGLNPILAANSSAGSYNASVPALSQQGDGGHGSSSASGDPLQIAKTRAAISQASSATKAQKALAELYATQAERMRYLPLTESDNGGFSIFGNGFNAGGTDTLLFDTKTGQVIRPKSQGAGGTSSGSETFVTPASSGRTSSQPSVSPGLQHELEKRGITLEELFRHGD